MNRLTVDVDSAGGIDFKDKYNIPAIVKAYLLQTEYNSPEYIWWVLGQWNHESKWYLSQPDYKALSPNFNTMGMRPVRQRTTYQLDGSVNGEGKYGIYRNYLATIADLVEYWRNIKLPTNLKGTAEYVDYLKSKTYFTGNRDTYLAAINKYFDKYGQEWLVQMDNPKKVDGSTGSVGTLSNDLGEKKKSPMGVVALILLGVFVVIRIFKKRSKYGKR